MRDLIRSNIKKEINRVLIERKSDEAHYRLAMLYLNGWLLNTSPDVSKDIDVQINLRREEGLIKSISRINTRDLESASTFGNFDNFLNVLFDTIHVSVRCKRSKIEQSEVNEIKEIDNILERKENYPIIPKQLALFFNNITLYVTKFKGKGGHWAAKSTELALNITSLTRTSDFGRFILDYFKNIYFQRTFTNFDSSDNAGNILTIEDALKAVEYYFLEILNNRKKWNNAIGLSRTKSTIYHELGHAFDYYIQGGPYTDIKEKMYPLSRESKHPSKVYYSANNEIQANITRLNITLNQTLDEITFLFNLFEKIFKKGKKKKRIKKYNEPFKAMLYLRDLCKDFQIVVENKEYDDDLTNPKLKGDLKNLANEIRQKHNLSMVLQMCQEMRRSLNFDQNKTKISNRNKFSNILHYIALFKYEDRNKGIGVYLNDYAIPIFGERYFRNIEKGYTLPKKRHGRTKNRKYSGRKQTNRVISRMLDLLLSAVEKYDEASKFYK